MFLAYAMLGAELYPKGGDPWVPQAVGAGVANGKAGPFMGLLFSGLERRGAVGAWAGMGKPLARCKMRTCWKKGLRSSCPPTSPAPSHWPQFVGGGIVALRLLLGCCSGVFPEL